LRLPIYCRQIIIYNNQMTKEKALVAMSGGIDSFVAAALLKKRGFNVSAVFMRLYDGKISKEQETFAKKAALRLNINLLILDLRKEFKKEVVNYFLNGYKKGITPNPCVVCNKKIKFNYLLKTAEKLEAAFIATGHYARKKKAKIGNKKPKTIYKLLAAKDREKDQSYFLWQLDQKTLKNVLFPIGKYTKKEIKKLAKNFGFPAFKIKESQNACFLKGEKLEAFLKNNLKGTFCRPGRILTREGKLLGKHQGLCLYTIGQRKGLYLSKGPWYVFAKDIEKNILVVTNSKKDLWRKKIIAKNVNWIQGKFPEKLPKDIKAKIRYRDKASKVSLEKVSKKGKVCLLEFKEAKQAVASGQSVVFYHKNELLGGGIISNNLL